MKMLLFAAATLSAAASMAGTYYVDAVYGDDANDGLKPGTGRALQSLAAAMALAGDGDIVYAAPGVYSNKTCMSGSVPFRVCVKKNVSLVASGTAEETVIMGKISPEGVRVDDYGNGPDAVRCVSLASGSRLEGFTVTGNRHTATPTDHTDGGGVSGSNAIVADCIISNNVAYRGGGAYVSGLDSGFVNCFFTNNIACNAGLGANMYYGKAYNCVFTGIGGSSTYFTTCYNCSFVGRGGYGPRDSDIYNCLIARPFDSSVRLYSCVYVPSPSRTATSIDGNSVSVSASDIAFDSGFRPVAGSLAINAGSNEVYSVPASLDHRKWNDFSGGQRIVGGRIDCGALEFGGDLRGDFGKALSPSRVKVVAFSDGVATNGLGGLTIPAGGFITGFWAYPAGGSGVVPFHFTASLEDGAALVVTRAGADEPLMTITATGSYAFSSDVHETLEFAASGGAVGISGLWNSSYVKVVDSSGGLAVSGGTVGVNDVLPGGGPVTVTVSRNYSTVRLCLGVNVNGTFYSFTGADADTDFSCTVSDGDNPVTIEAVYGARNDWYVRPDGDDGNSGYTPYSAKRTLAGAMAITGLAPNDVVHALPGVYSEGLMAPLASATNRVTVPAGVGLVADGGPDVTVIEGFVPDVPAKGDGSSVRCVYLKSGAYVKGFTLRNGSTGIEAGTGNRYFGQGGGVYGGTAIDCVISNCYAVRGGGAASSTLIRCRVSSCGNVTGKNSDGGTAAATTAEGMFYGSAYDSYIGSAVLGLGKAVNCFFGSYAWSSGPNRTPLYNCYVETDYGYLALTNCILRGNCKDTSVLGVASRENTTFRIDANMRPRFGSCAVDAGDRTYYTYPSAFAHEAGMDIMRGNRIFGANIDIGCGEWRWTGLIMKIR